MLVTNVANTRYPQEREGREGVPIAQGDQEGGHMCTPARRRRWQGPPPLGGGRLPGAAMAA
eukprot:6488301-Pyramimonas_sp.AAC.1